MDRIYQGTLDYHIYVGFTCPFTRPFPQSHPKAAPFRKKGFLLYDEIGFLIDGTRATGEFAFRTGLSPGPSFTRHSSPATPPGDDFDSRIDPVLLGISNNSTNTTKSCASFDWEKEREEYETHNTVSIHP